MFSKGEELNNEGFSQNCKVLLKILLNWTPEIETLKERHVCIWIEFMALSFKWALGALALGCGISLWFEE